MQKVEKLPVIIRVEAEGRRLKSHAPLNDIIAVFPTQLGKNDPRSMSCYSTMGGHGSCVAGYIGAKTRPATKEEQYRMFKELWKIGYRNLKVVSRASAGHYKIRVKAGRG